MTPRLLLFVPLLAAPLAAQSPAPLAPADSQLIHRILVAEDARDSAAAALRAGASHADPRVRSLAARARARITDPAFAARESLVGTTSATAWPEPDWQPRFRALVRQTPCADLVRAFSDDSWHVRLRAVGLVAAACKGDDAAARAVPALRAWVTQLPADVSRRERNGVSWHAGAAALVTLAALDPATARAALPRYLQHDEWHLRRAAVRAAAVLADTAVLRAGTRDRHPNVQETAIESLFALTGRADDSIYVRRMQQSQDAQVVRAAATALKGVTRVDVMKYAKGALYFWDQRANDAERDVRNVLREVGGRTNQKDRAPYRTPDVPRDAVALALGADVRLRVEMDPSSGGGAFVVRLRGDLAPIMAARIRALAEEGYYDGKTWHRVEPDFVIQGGSATDNEYVGHRDFLRDELATLAHPRGTVGMSTRGHDTGDAQWFVNLRDNARLTKDYTIFAEIVEGMDVVHDVQEGDRIARIRVVPSPAAPSVRAVDGAWLAPRLADSSVVLLHVTTDSTEFAAAHIPGAREVPYRQFVARQGTVTNELPSDSAAAALFARLGVDGTKPVVVYAAEAPMATRLLFTLAYFGVREVAYLDGGLEAWRADGRPVAAGTAVVASSERTTPTIIRRAELLADASYLQDRIGQPGTSFVDTRTRGEYEGTGNRSGMPSLGHVAGARQLEWEELFADGKRRLKPRAELERLYRERVRPGDAVVTYCWVGYRASATWFVASLLGYEARLYDGSYQDWSQRALPTSMGSAP